MKAHRRTRLSIAMNLISVLALEKFTENILTQADQLLEVTVEIRQKKVGVDNEEFIEGMVGIAVPVNDDKNYMVAAMVFHAPTVRMDLDIVLTYIST